MSRRTRHLYHDFMDVLSLFVFAAAAAIIFWGAIIYAQVTR